MKIFACLLCVAVIVQSSDIFNVYKQQNDVILDNARDMIRTVMNDDGTDFRPYVKELLALVESQVCPEEVPEEGDQCDSDSNWLLGCRCTSEFSALEGSCKNTPCKMVHHMKDSGPKAMSDFMSADNYEEMFKVVMDCIEEVWRILCECRGVVDATINCVRSYDGQAFVLSGIDRTQFDEIVDHLDWETVRGILHGYLDAICGEQNGEDCLAVFNTWQAQAGIFYDNTFSGVDNCMSMVRLETEIGAYMKSQVYEEGMDTKSYFYGMVEAYMEMEEVAMCGADCAQEIQEAYYGSCCVKRAGEGLSSESMKWKYTKLVKNLWSLFYSGKVPKVKALKGAVDRFFSMYRPANFCGDKTDVYKKKDKQCDAIKLRLSGLCTSIFKI